MNTLIGDSAHGKNRAYEVIKHNNFVDEVKSLNNHFSDAGLFGISVTGAGSHSADLLQVATEELSKLKDRVSDEELARAKNRLKMNILLNLDKQDDRLEEIAKNFLTFGDLTFHKYCDQIDAVTADDIHRAAGHALQSKPTMVVTGGAINLVPGITDVQRQLH